MEQMTMEDLEKILEQWKNETIIFDLTGLITTTVRIEYAETKSTQEDIMIKNQHFQEESIILNKHQIMKIVKGEENCFLVKFDDLQMVRICRYQEIDI